MPFNRPQHAKDPAERLAGVASERRFHVVPSSVQDRDRLPDAAVPAPDRLGPARGIVTGLALAAVAWALAALIYLALAR